MDRHTVEYRREYDAETRALFKRLHLCKECKNQDAYTLAGRTYCFECAKKQAEYKQKQRERDGGQANRERCKARVERLKAEHKCMLCAKELPVGYAFNTCERCLAKQRQSQAAKRREKCILPWAERCKDGWCFICNKRPAIEGKKLCRECYDKKVPILLANAKKAKEGHPWKNQRYGKGLLKANNASETTAKFTPLNT